MSVLGTAGYKGWSVLKATWKEMWLSGMSQLKHGCPRTWCVGGAMSQHKMADSDCPGNLKVNGDIICYIIILGTVPLV